MRESRLLVEEDVRLPREHLAERDARDRVVVAVHPDGGGGGVAGGGGQGEQGGGPPHSYRAAPPAERRDPGMEDVMSIMKELKRENEMMKNELQGLAGDKGGGGRGGGGRRRQVLHGRRSNAQPSAPQAGRRQAAPRLEPESVAESVRSETVADELDATDEEILHCFYSYMDPALCSDLKIEAIIGSFRQKWGGSRRRPNGTLWRDKMYEKIGEKRGVDPRDFFRAEQVGEAHLYMPGAEPIEPQSGEDGRRGDRDGYGEDDRGEYVADGYRDGGRDRDRGRGGGWDADRDQGRERERERDGRRDHDGGWRHEEHYDRHDDGSSARRRAPRTPNSELESGGYNVQDWSAREADSNRSNQYREGEGDGRSGDGRGGEGGGRQGRGGAVRARTGGPVVSRRAKLPFSPRVAPNPPAPSSNSTRGDNRRQEEWSQPPPIPPQEYGFQDYYEYGGDADQGHPHSSRPPAAQNEPPVPHSRVSLEQLSDQELNGMLRAARIDPRGLRSRADALHQLRAVFAGGEPGQAGYGGAAPPQPSYAPERGYQQGPDYGPGPGDYGQAQRAPPPGHGNDEVPVGGGAGGDTAAAQAQEERRLSGKGQAAYVLPEVRKSSLFPGTVADTLTACVLCPCA